MLAMEREGRVVKIATDLYFSRAAADTARDRLVEYLKTVPKSPPRYFAICSARRASSQSRCSIISTTSV